MGLKEEVMEVATATLRVPVGCDACMDNTPQWDSLNYIQVVGALEERFGVTFSNDELGRLHSIESICAALSARQVER